MTTTAIDVDTIGRAEPKRDRWGRYLLPTPDGTTVAHTRATTVAETIDDRYNLERWKMRQVAHGIGLRTDLYALAASHHPDTDRGTYDRLCEQALEASKSSAAASQGTALHRFTERLDQQAIGLDDIPGQWRQLAETYQTTLARNGLIIDPERIEQIVIHDDYTVAGTCDRIATIPDGRTVIADLKTGKSLNWSWLAISIQLAIYAFHTATYDPATDTRGPRVDVDRDIAVVIHLPASGPDVGACQLYQVDLAAGWDAFLTAVAVRGHRKNAKALAAPLQIATPGYDPVIARAWIAERISALPSAAVADLRNRWPDTIQQPFPTEPTVDQVDTLAAVLDRVEAAHQIPFGAVRPAGSTNNDT